MNRAVFTAVQFSEFSVLLNCAVHNGRPQPMVLARELLAPGQRLVGGPQVTFFIFSPLISISNNYFFLSLQVHSHGEIPRPLRPLAVAAGGGVPHPAAGGGGEGLLPPAGDRPGGAGRQEDAKLGHDLFFIKNCI